MTKKEMVFLGGRMKQLREKNGVKSLESMREFLTARALRTLLIRNAQWLIG